MENNTATEGGTFNKGDDAQDYKRRKNAERQRKWAKLKIQNETEEQAQERKRKNAERQRNYRNAKKRCKPGIIYNTSDFINKLQHFEFQK